MYKFLIRPILFLFSPESIHHFIVFLLKFAFQLPGVGYFTRKVYSVKNPQLTREFLGFTFDNPIGFAAGFDKNAEVYKQFRNFGFSFIEIGTVTPKAQSGNPKPRSFRIPKDKGLINRMGFNNRGVDYAVDRLRNRKKNLIIGGNIGKNTATSNDSALSDYEYCFNQLYDYVDYFVVNLSCPNIKDLRKLQDKESTEAILDRLVELRTQKADKRPILLKIAPDLNESQLDEVIEIFNNSKIDGIVATNTTVSRENLVTDQEKITKIANGGMSGQPLTQKSLDIVRYLSKKSNRKIPIIGVGGIMTVQDAMNMIDAGATLIQVYTGFIYNGPGFVKRINKRILKS